MAISPAPPRPGAHAWPMDRLPDPEVPERPARRRFAAAYKAAILDELDQATEPGSKGAIIPGPKAGRLRGSAGERRRDGQVAAMSGHSDICGSRPHGSSQPEPATDCARRSSR